MSGLTTGQKISDELRLLLAANVRCGSEAPKPNVCFRGVVYCSFHSLKYIAKECSLRLIIKKELISAPFLFYKSKV